MTRIDPATSRVLDAARWMSALAVVLSHAAALFIAGPDRVPGWGVRVLAGAENAGHLAVVIFFVLSGYLVGGQELLRVLDGRAFDARRYAIQRFSRIYTVVVPALLLTLALDTLGGAAFNGSELYTRPAVQGLGSLQYAIAERDGWATLLGNMLMLQTITVEPLGGNGPLWSLANEWWYYVVFGLALAGSRGRGRFVALGAGGLLLGVLPASISVWFLVWLVGVGAAVLGRSWPGLPFGRALAVMGGCFFAGLLGMAVTPDFAVLPGPVQVLLRVGIDLVAGAGFAVLVLSARRLRGRGAGTLHARLAAFSFSLYAIHFPVLVLLGAMAHDWAGLRFARPPDAAGALLVAGVTLVICGAAWLFAQATERQTPRVRDALTRWFGRTPPGSPRAPRWDGRPAR